MKLNDLIAIANKAYPDDMIKGYAENPKAKPGDDLAMFIAVELSETFDKDEETKTQLEQAFNVMNKARGELESVCRALQSELDKPKKLLEEQRGLAAEKAWCKAKLPEVKDSEEWNSDGRFWSRKVFWETDDAMGSKVGSFGVEFEDGTDKVIDTWNQ
jgi:hypothetical protein